MSDKPQFAATSQEEKLATTQGEALTAALMAMKKQDQYLTVNTADYIITIAVEKAEGWYELQDDGVLQWHTPEPDMNQHIEVVVQDIHDKRFLPYLNIHCVLLTEDGKTVGVKQQRFIWHPFLFHYGENWAIPGPGRYQFKVTIAPHVSSA